MPGTLNTESREMNSEYKDSFGSWKDKILLPTTKDGKVGEGR